MTQMTVPVRDLMNRTRDNLTAIDLLEKGNGATANVTVWDVTQLVNSFARIVMHPWEAWEEELKKIPFDSEDGRRWPRFEPFDTDDEEVTTVGQQIRLVRNAFAHGNIIFEADEENEISSFVIWNSDPSNKDARTWASRVSTDDLRRLLDSMIERTTSFRQPEAKKLPPHRKHAIKRKNPQCPTCGHALKRGHVLYPSLVSSSQSESS
jgi:hypothetical protein